MKTWVTADYHLGHKNIIKFCDRPFPENAFVMDRNLIDQLNDIVSHEDELWMLGDFTYRGDKPKQYLEQLLCKKVHLVIGNHDRYYNDAGFASVQHGAQIKVNGIKVLLNHYPLASFPSSRVNLHGHTHGKFPKKPRQLDVGWDVFNRPLLMEEAVKIAMGE